jgi:hypothetical protein
LKRLFFVILILLPSAFNLLPAGAQPLNSIFENNTLVSFDKYVYGLDSAFHTSMRPYLVTDMRKTFDYDSIVKSYKISKYADKKALNLIFNRSLIVLNKKDYGFTIDPLFDWGTGYDFKNNSNTWINTRGFLVTGYLGKNFAFATTFYETQAKVPLWINDYVSLRDVMPGQGMVKPFGNGAWDYGNASGYISWSPSKFFNFQLGHGKQFWGDGYRSLILSDFSLYHPYIMLDVQFWKIKYLVMYSEFTHPDAVLYNTSGDPIYARKYSTMHYLSFTPRKRWDISFFETIVWQSADSNVYRGFDPNYLNPIIFFQPIEYNLGSGDNVLMGLNLRFIVLKGFALYSQFVIDEFKYSEMISGKGWSGNKYAWQLGGKAFDVFGVNGLNLQTEFNLIRPYTYSHYTLVENYSNAKEPLAHPSGANIKEVVAIAKYNWNRLYFNAKYIWSAGGLDTAGLNFGKNIFLSYLTAPNEYGNYTTQGLYTTLNQLDLSVSYLLNPATNANFFVGATLRREKNSQMDKSYTYFNFGFRTSLRNLYYDFF